jgi:hypothetical protein
MRIVESDERRWCLIALSLDVYVSGTGVANRERAGLPVESVSFALQVIAARDRYSSDTDRVRNKVQAKDISRVRVEGRVGDLPVPYAIFVTTEREPSRCDSSAGAHSGTAQKATRQASDRLWGLVKPCPCVRHDDPIGGGLGARDSQER